MWSEFDFEARTWAIPAAHSKNGRSHILGQGPKRSRRSTGIRFTLLFPQNRADADPRLALLFRRPPSGSPSPELSWLDDRDPLKLG
jgi:hypothetical protein